MRYVNPYSSTGSGLSTGSGFLAGIAKFFVLAVSAAASARSLDLAGNTHGWVRVTVPVDQGRGLR